MASIPTVSLADAQPGDSVAFVRKKGYVPRAIRLGQSLRWWFLWRRTRPELKQCCQYTHIAKLYQKDSDGTWIIAQAEASGTHLAKLEPDNESSFIVIPLTAFPTINGQPVDRARVVAEAKRLLGDHYGFITIGSIGVNMALPRFLDVMRPGTLVCSAYANVCDHAGGVAVDMRDVYQNTPAEAVGLAIPAEDAE